MFGQTTRSSRRRGLSGADGEFQARLGHRNLDAARKMIAFIAGMPRSGSTFAFNVARDVLRARGHLLQKNSPNVLAELARAGNADHVLLKDHAIDDSGLCLARYGAMRLICTVRRPEDAVASWMELLGVSEEQSIDVMRRWLLLYRRIKPFALTVNYLRAN